MSFWDSTHGDVRLVHWAYSISSQSASESVSVSRKRSKNCTVGGGALGDGERGASGGDGGGAGGCGGLGGACQDTKRQT